MRRSLRKSPSMLDLVMTKSRVCPKTCEDTLTCCFKSNLLGRHIIKVLRQYPIDVEKLSPPFLRAAQATLMSLHCFDGVFGSVMLTETLYSLSSSNNSTRIELHRGSSTTSIMVIQTLIRPSFSNKLISWRGKITCLSYFIFCP